MQKTLHSKEYKQLTTWLKTKRISRGLTIRELAGKMTVAHSFIGKVEQGERRLDVVEFVRYCEALKLSPDEGIAIISKQYK